MEKVPQPDKNIISQQGISPQELVIELLKYDVVSFDIFDTLIFRRLSQPDDLFDIVGQKLSDVDFAKNRISAEAKARRKGEITLYDIYDKMKYLTDAEKEKAMEIELETEIEVCYPNPYMASVYESLKQSFVRLIIISDMYLSKQAIGKLLNNCGYTDYDRLFVSCEYKTSKQKGELYEVVRRETGEYFSYIHIGDNGYSDVVQAKKHGFEAVHYIK